MLKKMLEDWDTSLGPTFDNGPVLNQFDIIGDDMKGAYKSILSSYTMMVSGAVILSIFAVVAIIGIVFYLLNRKRK